MANHHKNDPIDRLLAPVQEPPDVWPRPAAADEVSRVLAVCETGALEDRLRTAARTLGQHIRFFRAFPEALATLAEQFYEIIVVGKASNGMPVRDFVREVKRISDDSVVVVAAPGPGHLTELMVEGAYDLLPREADDGQLRLMLGRAMDHSRLRRRSNRLERALDAQTSSLQQRLNELAMLNEVTQDLISVSDLDEILSRALRRLVDVFGSGCGSFLILEPGTSELVVRAAEGPGAAELLGRRQKMGEGVAGRVASARHPVLVTDVTQDSRFRSVALSAEGVRHYRSGSFIAVPLLYRGRLLGEMNIAEKGAGSPFTQDDLRLLATLAGHIASAIDSALGAEELRKANDALRAEMAAAKGRLRLTNEKLVQAEGLAIEVVERLPTAMAAFDADLNVTFANATARAQLGLDPGCSLETLAARRELAPVLDAARQVVGRGAMSHLAVDAGPEGRPAARLSVALAPLRQADGARAGGTLVAAPLECPVMKRVMEKR